MARKERVPLNDIEKDIIRRVLKTPSILPRKIISTIQTRIQEQTGVNISYFVVKKQIEKITSQKQDTKKYLPQGESGIRPMDDAYKKKQSVMRKTPDTLTSSEDYNRAILRMIAKKEEVVYNLLKTQADRIITYENFFAFGNTPIADIMKEENEERKIEFIKLIKEGKKGIKDLSSIDILLVNSPSVEGQNNTYGKIILPFYIQDALDSSKRQIPFTVYNGLIVAFKDTIGTCAEISQSQFGKFISADFNTKIDKDAAFLLQDRVNEYTGEYASLKNTKINIVEDMPFYNFIFSKEQ